MKGINSIVKMMLEEDEYKRDTFITLIQKIKPMIIKNSSEKSEIQKFMRDERFSENSRSEDSHKEKREKEKWKGTTELQRKSLISLLFFCFSFFILLFIL